MKNNTRLFKSIKGMTLSAMLVAMSVVIGIFCESFLDFGNGLRITFENLPIIVSGVLYGPVVGAIVGAASDLVGCLFPGKSYPIPLVTVGAALVGAVSGIVARFIIKKKGRVQIILSGALAHITGSMIVKSIGLYQFYGISVLFRIPLYIAIASVEIFIICLLFDRASFRRAVGYSVGESL